MRLARWISIVAHPFVVAIVTVATTAVRLAPPAEAMRTVVTFTVIAVVPVLVLMIRQVRRGAWGNVDASQKKERPLLYAVGIGATLALLVYLAITAPDSFLVHSSIRLLPMLALCALITRWIKLSLHMLIVATCATLLLIAGSVVGWILAAVAPLLAWSRLKLTRHTPVEVILGTIAGVVTALVIRYV